jgi:hypothetical protein
MLRRSSMQPSNSFQRSASSDDPMIRARSPCSLP